MKVGMGWEQVITATIVTSRLVLPWRVTIRYYIMISVFLVANSFAGFSAVASCEHFGCD